MPGGKARVPFFLSLVGGMFYLVISLAVLYAASIGANFYAVYNIGLGSNGDLFAEILAGVGLISALAILLGAAMMNSSSAERVKRGGTLVLLFTIVGLFPVGGGYIIGFILALVGGIMGLRWKPSEQAPAAMPQPGPASP
ncbi:MAG TPA: hypothetical protein VFE91_07810 [Nitrososphaerales archaeon]|nr:hypothetical protein [Nitrososphaerales archaeon]